MTIGGKVVACTSKFKYLGSEIQSNWEIDGDVTNRIQAGWLKWRAATGVLCDKKFPKKLKGKFYRVAIRPVLYGTKCWPVKKVFEQRKEVIEMCILRCTCGNTMMDRIRNQEFKEKLRVAPLSAKMRENRLR